MEVPESKATSDCANTGHEGFKGFIEVGRFRVRIDRVKGEEESTRGELVV